MRQKFIIGNWKMHTNAAGAGRLAAAIVGGVGHEDLISVVICPPLSLPGPGRRDSEKQPCRARGAKPLP